MTNDELIKFARRFEFPNGTIVDYRGKEKWVVIAQDHVWSEEDCCWHWEPMPSNRTDEFITKTRYVLGEAVQIAQRLDKDDDMVHGVNFVD